MNTEIGIGRNRNVLEALVRQDNFCLPQEILADQQMEAGGH
jgi:hypothetical protein